jgi:EAL domain-containing protein (putative c-di-GMP-specific phosphodiesterase class I)
MTRAWLKLLIARGVNQMAIDRNQNGDAQAHQALDPVRALEQHEIDVHFQPKVDLRSGRVIGVEALARWSHPDLGLLTADTFIDQVKASGRMRDLTERVIKLATRAAGDWWRSGLRLQLSVNLRSEDISAGERNLDGFVSDALSAAHLPGKAVQFEITENCLISDPARAAEALERLTRLGATIAIDDFGTGHFSLRQLVRLPLEELKIDRGLIIGLDDEENRTIVRAIIHLAHQVGLPVVAEGVETRDTWQQLRSMGCERAQGALIGDPLPAREVPAWLAAWNQRARELRPTKRLRRRTKIGIKRGETPAEATA